MQIKGQDKGCILKMICSNIVENELTYASNCLKAL